MKTKVEKIDLKVKRKLWGTHWGIIPMIIVVLILCTTGNGNALKGENLWYLLFIVVLGRSIRILEIPYMTIITLIVMWVFNGLKDLEANDAISTSLVVAVGILYDHYLLRKETKSRDISKSEMKEYLDMMEDQVSKSISHLYDRKQSYNIKSDKLQTSLSHEQQEFEEAKKFSGDTRNFEKSIQRKEIDIEKIKDLLKKNQEISDDLTSALDAIQAKQKSMRLA